MMRPVPTRLSFGVDGFSSPAPAGFVSVSVFFVRAVVLGRAKVRLSLKTPVSAGLSMRSCLPAVRALLVLPLICGAVCGCNTTDGNPFAGMNEKTVVNDAATIVNVFLPDTGSTNVDRFRKQTAPVWPLRQVATINQPTVDTGSTVLAGAQPGAGQIDGPVYK
jgi:hypothetical protein